MAECHPVGFQWVMEAKRARREGHPRRPALHPHQRGRRPARRRSARAPTSPSSAGSSTTSSRTSTEFREYVVAYTNAPTIIDEDFATPRTSTASSPAGTPRRPSYDPSTWQLRGRARAAAAGEREQGGRRAASVPRRARLRRLERRAAADATTTLQHPRCVFQILQAPLRPLHPGDGRARSAASRRSSSRAVAERWSPTPAASAPPPSSTRSAGPSTPSACRTSAPPAILQLLLGNIGRPAAGSWRCAATPRSRAPPTSRRSTTPPRLHADAARRRARRPRRLHRQQHAAATGYWGTRRRVHRSAC